jgi:hypothetical protein
LTIEALAATIEALALTIEALALTIEAPALTIGALGLTIGALGLRPELAQARWCLIYSREANALNKVNNEVSIGILFAATINTIYLLNQ